jgi:hypothetical protein
MRPTQLEKRLGAAEAMVAKLVPPAPAPAWAAALAWCTDSELTALQLICDRDPDGGLTEADQLRVQSIVLQATTRMVEGAPSERDRDRGYRTARP